MKITLTVLLSLVISSLSYAGDLGKVQADRILKILEAQTDGSLAFEEMSTAGSVPFFINVSNTKFSIREVKGNNLTEKATLYFKPRFEIVMTKKDNSESKVVDTRNLFIKKSDYFSNIRLETRDVDQEAKEDINNLNVYVSCSIIRHGNYGLEHLSTCETGIPTRYNRGY